SCNPTQILCSDVDEQYEYDNQLNRDKHHQSAVMLHSYFYRPNESARPNLETTRQSDNDSFMIWLNGPMTVMDADAFKTISQVTGRFGEGTLAGATIFGVSRVDAMAVQTKYAIL